MIPRYRRRHSLWAAPVLAGVLICVTDVAYGSASGSCQPVVLTLAEAAELLRVDEDEVERLAEKREVPGRRIGSAWRFDRSALMVWLQGDREPRLVLEGAVTCDQQSSDAPGGLQPLTPTELAVVVATGTDASQENAAPSNGATPGATEEGPLGEAPDERTAEEVFLRGQRLLLGPGEVVVELGQFYFRRDSLQLASVSQGVGLSTVEQESFATLLLGRVGIFNETEIFSSTTFLRENRHEFLGSVSLARAAQQELGDVRVGVRRTLLREGAGRPDVIATVDGRFPTGGSSYAFGGGLVLVKSVDPVVLFANASYLHTFAREISDVARLDAEDRFSALVGYGLALNDTLAISTAVSGSFAGETKLGSTSVRPPDVFSARFALTSWLAEGLYIEPSVTFGLGGPADSFALGVTLPYSF